MLRITVSVWSGRRIRTRRLCSGGDIGAANRTIGVATEPHINARSVKRMLAHAQLPDLFPVGEHRQAHRTLSSDFLHTRLLLVLYIGDFAGVFNIVVRELGRNGGIAG
ncbi:hypothetical protein Lal_00032902 [Lupinus albus]|nr:hypothetical protein Lal_00032902 [Lupinus albus]